MSAEWGLVDIIHDSLRQEAERLKESRFLTYTAELKLGDYQQTLQRVNPNYAEEQDYLNKHAAGGLTPSSQSWGQHEGPRNIFE